MEKNESKVDGISFKTSVCFLGNYMGLQEILLSSESAKALRLPSFTH